MEALAGRARSIAALAVATLSDVARRAGVSEATASRVLNGRRHVAAATRDRVRQAALDLEYVPHHAARGLAMARSATVALLVHHSQYPAHGEGTFSSRVVDGISRELRAGGHDLLYMPVDNRGVRNLTTIPSIRAGRTDGVIVLGPAFPRDALRALRASGRPIVLVDNRMRDTDAVLADNRRGMAALGRHLVADHGYRRIACFAGPATWPSTEERIAGIRDAMVGTPAQLTVLRARETTMRDGAALAARILADRPDVIVAVNDAMAIGAIHRLRGTAARGIPVTGFDDIAWAQLSEPPLTTVAVDAAAIGAEAARLLLARLGDDPLSTSSPARDIRVPAMVRVRRSCGCGPDPVSSLDRRGGG